MIGILAGTSLLESNLFRELQATLIRTEYGSVNVFLTPNSSDLPKVAVVQRHDRDGSFAPPHRINHHANLMALKQVGATTIIGIYSVGGLREAYGPGTLVVPDDYLNPWSPATFHEGKPENGFITPEISPALRESIIGILEGANLPKPPETNGVYVQTRGPRFETRAEVRMLAHYGHVIGMTGAQEADLAQELGLPFAMVCMVDNYAHGASETGTLSWDEFKAEVGRNQATMEQVVELLVRGIPATPAGDTSGS